MDIERSYVIIGAGAVMSLLGSLLLDAGGFPHTADTLETLGMVTATIGIFDWTFN